MNAIFERAGRPGTFVNSYRNTKLSNTFPLKWLNQYPNFSLAPVGLVALASIDTVARKTALRGTSSYLDALIICPGLHKQQDAPDLSKGEYPACAAMTTGYVFRVENEATVLYLQKVGRSGHLTTLSVSSVKGSSVGLRTMSKDQCSASNHILASFCYPIAIALTLIVLVLDFLLEDWCALAAVSILIVARLINVITIRHRAILGWKGAAEPGVNGDLLILLSQDRWIRMHGAVDDLKAVTSGQWLRGLNSSEGFFVSFATILVFLTSTLTANAGRDGNLLLLVLLLCSAALLGVANGLTRDLCMYDRTVAMHKAPKQYKRRLDLVKELIGETGRADWAVRLGMIQPEAVNDSAINDQGPKVI